MPKMPQAQKAEMLAVSRYRREDYAKFRNLPPADNGMEDTFDEWKAFNDAVIPGVIAKGARVEYVDMVFEEYVAWLRQAGIKHSPESRARYVHEIISARLSDKQ